MSKGLGSRPTCPTSASGGRAATCFIDFKRQVSICIPEKIRSLTKIAFLNALVAATSAGSVS